MVSLSVIITSPDRSRLTDNRDLLISIRNQSFRDFEVIYIVEKDSDFLTREIQGIMDGSGIETKVLTNVRERGVAQARNLGINASRGEWLAIIDDDVILPEHWASLIFKTASFKERDVIGMTGPAFPYWIGKKIDWLPKSFYWLISCSEWFDVTSRKEVRGGQGMNMVFKREAFEKAGGFLRCTGFHKPISEDLEFSLRVRHITRKKIMLEPSLYVFHKVPSRRFNWNYVTYRSHHIGKCQGMINRLYDDELHGEWDWFQSALRILPRESMRMIDLPKVVGLVTLIAVYSGIGYLGVVLNIDPGARLFLRKFRKSPLISWYTIDQAIDR